MAENMGIIKNLSFSDPSNIRYKTEDGPDCHRGCLNIIPASETHDLNKSQKTLRACSEWSKKANEIISEFITGASKLQFFVSQTHDNVNFGDIKSANEEGEPFSLCELIIKKNLAIGTEDPIAEITKLGLLKTKSDSSPQRTNFEKLDKAKNESMVCKIVVSSPKPLSDEQRAPFLPKGSSSSFAKIVKKLKPTVQSKNVFKILVQGESLQDPLETVKEASFPQKVHEGLSSLNLRSIYRSQSHCWPNILEGRSMCIVNNEKSGKTLSYLPAILSSIIYGSEVEAAWAPGPVGVIIVNSSKQVENIYNISKKLVDKKKFKIVKASGKWNCENKKVDLVNGCELLITTLPCFSRLAVGDVFTMFDKKKIKHLVLDDIDTMLYQDLIKKVIETCTNGDCHPELNPQIIVTSSSWNFSLRQLMKLSCEPIVVIGSFAEAAVYAKCHFTISKNSLDQKVDRLLKELCNEQWMTTKTLIVSNDEVELCFLKAFLENHAIGFCSINEELHNEEMKELAKSWPKELPGEMTIMLATDSTLAISNFKCVKHLIHFSLPGSWTTFSARFSVMIDAFMDFVSGKKEEGKTQTIVMLEESNDIEIPRLIDFVKTRGVLKEVPEEIEDFVVKVVENREASNKIEAEICSKFLLFGSCDKMMKCDKRHSFYKFDNPSKIPGDGLVKFELIRVLSPVHYVIKILEYLPLNEKRWISCELRTKKIEESLITLQQKMMDSPPTVQVQVNVNDLCAVFNMKLNKWCRGKVISKQATEKPPYKVKIHLIDFGPQLVVKSTDLMFLSYELTLFDPLVTNLRIPNLVPYDNDFNWDVETTTNLEKFLLGQKKSGEFNCKVEMAINSTIFAETFEIRQHADSINVDVVKYSLKKDLLAREYCLEDVNVSDKLKNLMKSSCLYVPVEAPKVVECLKIEVLVEKNVRWKRLSTSRIYQVSLKRFETPEKLFVLVNSDENNILKYLMKKIEDFKELEPLLEVKEESYCLFVKDQKPQRAVVVTTKPLTILLLDVGEQVECTETEIFELPASLIEAVPFQAVQCRLVGVKPKYYLAEWKKRPALAFQEFLQEICDGKCLSLQVVRVTKNVHEVVLFHPETFDRIDKLAVAKGYAATSDEEICEEEFLESDDEDEEDSIEEGKKIIKLLGTMNHCDLSTLFIKAPEVQLPSRPRRRMKFKVNKKSADQEGKLSTFDYIHKHPMTEWRQNDAMIYFIISATDSVDYSIKVDDASLQIVVKYEDRQEVASLMFYGLVQAELASHEKSGHSIIVRLMKHMSSLFQWPRLEEIYEHSRNIRFSTEEIPKFANETEIDFPSRPPGESDEDEIFELDLEENGREPI